MSKDEKTEGTVFFPYYVNQPRLIDLFSLLNDGYSEYEEISVNSDKGVKTGKRADAQIQGGFKLFNLGGNAGVSREKNVSASRASTEKRVQTVPSMLGLTIKAMKTRGLLIVEGFESPENITTGAFVLPYVKLKINSVKSFMTEMEDLLKLANNMTAFASDQVNGKRSAKNTDLDQMKTMNEVVKQLVGTEEVISLSDKFALVGNIYDDNLYQASRQDLIGTDLRCLAQVKRIFIDGAPLLRNTMFAKLNNPKAKEEFVKTFERFSDGDVYNFEATVVTQIQNKPVYELELVALYLETQLPSD